MCCCEQPIINGQPGYKWQPSDAPGIRPVNPPDLDEHDELLYDEPGRCGGLDAHCHHYRIVKQYAQLFLLVRHGGGDERHRLSHTPTLLATLAAVDTNARYWLLHAIYHAANDAKRTATDSVNQKWIKAAAEKRIKTRRKRGTNSVKVWITEQ